MENIIFTRNAACVIKEVLNENKYSKVYVLVDENSHKLCLPLLGINNATIIEIPEGEHNKSIESLANIWETLMQEGAKRSSLLINIGGGLITDIGGFAASCFKRGITCINIPTTLLSQVDASVGGKTGINFGGLKNEIGSFSIPFKVIIDNKFLKTLPYRQQLSGFAEMLKHALLDSENELQEIMKVNLDDISESNFLETIKKSVGLKAKIVKEDPQEKGLRKALNLGHTVGHAIESAALEQNIELYHGDAIAYGLIVELSLSVEKLGFNAELYHEVKNYIKELYPAYSLCVSSEYLYELMLHDKKNENEGVNFSLLRSPGDIALDQYCSKEEIFKALKKLQ